MFLFHGTWEEEKDKILSKGSIEPFYTSEASELIDEVFLKRKGTNPREGCIYLSKDSISAEAYDYAFKISTKRLNKNLLYVGDYNISNKIYDIVMSGEGYEKLDELADSYMDSLIEFQSYEKDKNLYDRTYFPEFLYFGSIPVGVDDLS